MPKSHTILPAWPHVPRPTLAAQFLQPATEFGVRALTLFAPRGIGKTEFLQRDLIPFAQEQGFVCIYVDLWEASEGPAIALARAFERRDWDQDDAAPARRLAARAKAMLTPRIKSAKAELSMLGHSATFEAEFGEGRMQSNDVDHVVKAFAALLRRAKRRPVLLVVDEAQTLANPRFEPMVKTLRSLFQSHDEQVIRLFTGSSRMGLDRMFRRSRAPLFGQGGTMQAFPALDRAFVQQICRWFSARTGGADLGDAAAHQGFEKLHRSARLFRSAVESVLMGRSTNILSACEAAQFSLLDDATLRAKLADLSALQHEVLTMVWRQGSELYTVHSLKRLSKTLRVPVDLPQVQSALQRLERMELIYRAGHGEYRIELPELELAMEAIATQSDKK